MGITADFLTSVFGPKYQGYLLSWDGESKISEFHASKTIGDVEAMFQQRRPSDRYFGCCLRGRALDASKRGGRDQCVGAGGLWCDADYGDDGHKSSYSPRDVVLDILTTKLPLKPSVILDTGGGFHVWWIFTEPWIFDGEYPPDAEQQRTDFEAMLSR